METKNIFKYALGGLIVAGFFALAIGLLLLDIPEKNKDLLNLIVGALIGAFSTIVGFFYGSSLGSQEKNQILMKKNDGTGN